MPCSYLLPALSVAYEVNLTKFAKSRSQPGGGQADLCPGSETRVRNLCRWNAGFMVIFFVSLIVV